MLKSVLLATTAAAAAMAAAPQQLPDATPLTSAATAAALNADPALPWTAQPAPHGSWPAGKTVGDARQMLRARWSTQSREHRAAHPEAATPLDFEQREKKRMALGLPEAYDTRKAFPHCVTPVENQGQCGSCWSFGTTKSLSSRFCQHSQGKQKPILSPESLVSCDWEGNFGCDGGIPRLAFEYLEVAGALTTKCYPYTAGGGHPSACSHTCTNSSATAKKYYAKRFSATGLYDESEMMNDIYKNGPICGTFSVYSDFMHYKSGVYVQSPSATYLGGHAIDIVGWGVDKSGPKPLPYWIVSNSWGPNWGLDGYFWFLRGVDQDGMESDASSAMPAL